MGIFSSFIRKESAEKDITFEFTKDELSLIKAMPQGDKFNEIMRNKNLHEHTSTYIQGITMYFASAKNYPLAEKLPHLLKVRRRILLNNTFAIIFGLTCFINKEMFQRNLTNV